MRIHVFILLILGILFIASAGTAQTTTNPDISFIADTRVNAAKDSPDGINDPQLKFSEIEIAGSGYLNPYARADLSLGIHGTEGEIEVEEAYATILRGLPWNLQFKAGQYLVDFGKINTQHPHQWSWMERPLMFQRFFGEDGLRDVGLNLSSLVPLGNNSLTISLNALQGDFLSAHHHHDGETEEEETEATPKTAASGRLSLFTPVGTNSSLEMGISGLYGRHDPDEDRWATMGNFDLKYKWRLDMYRSLNIIAEILLNSRTIDSETSEDGEKISSYGAFTAIDYQFRRRYNAGLFYDFSQSPDDKNDEQTGFGIFAGFSMAEETYRIGVMARTDDASDFDTQFQTFMLQFLWSLGPHKPHTF